MPLVKRGEITRDDFVHVGEDLPLPEDGAVLVSATRFLADPELLLRHEGRIGVIWPNGRDIDALVPYLDRLATIALVFPTFRDGRAYSQARLLRERLGYQGELRATGAVFLDQLPFLLRCGFSSFESDQKGFGEALEKARTLFSVVYQPVGDGRATAAELRLKRRNATVPLAAD